MKFRYYFTPHALITIVTVCSACGCATRANNDGEVTAHSENTDKPNDFSCPLGEKDLTARFRFSSEHHTLWVEYEEGTMVRSGGREQGSDQHESSDPYASVSNDEDTANPVRFDWQSSFSRKYLLRFTSLEGEKQLTLGVTGYLRFLKAATPSVDFSIEYRLPEWNKPRTLHRCLAPEIGITVHN